jgi:hypothetical protein
MMKRVAALTDSHASVVMDYRYLPAVAIAIWSGTISSKLIGDFCGELARLHEALGASQKYAIVMLATESCELPVAARFEAALQNDITRDSHKRNQVGSYLVVDNPLMRGAVIAIGWMSKTGLRSVLVNDLPQAFEEARKALQGAGVPWPVALHAANYIPPALPAPRTGTA